MSFTPRNDPSLVIVPDWSVFCDWAKDEGYPEEMLDWHDSRCLALQEQFLEELVEGYLGEAPDAGG